MGKCLKLNAAQSCKKNLLKAVNPHTGGNNLPSTKTITLKIQPELHVLKFYLNQIECT